MAIELFMQAGMPGAIEMCGNAHCTIVLGVIMNFNTEFNVHMAHLIGCGDEFDPAKWLDAVLQLKPWFEQYLQYIMAGELQLILVHVLYEA